MTEYKPRRRGRPPKAASEPVTVTADAPDTADDAPVRPAEHRRRSSVGGLNLKLAAPERPGFHRHWFVDNPNRLAMAEELAYTPVTDPGIKSDSPGGPVRRLSGTQANGQPQHLVLMETPLVEYQRGIDEKELQHRVIDEAIAAGRDVTGRVQDAYGEGSIRER